MAKSVIDIEVKAEAFDRFNALFKKYNDQLSKMPGQWGKVNEAIEGTSKTLDDVVASIDRVAEAVENMAEAQDKSAKNQRKFNKNAKDAEKTFGKIGAFADSIRKNVAGAAQNLMKLGTSTMAGGGLMALGGAFSIGALAGYAGDIRRQATGLGVSGSELKSAQTSYQKFIDVDRTLGAIAEAQADPSKHYAFATTGLDINKTPAQLIPDLLRRAGEVYRQDPTGAATQLKAMGFGQFGIGVEEARRADAMRKEITLAETRNQKTREQLNLQDKTLEKWQTLGTTIDESKNSIKSAFLDSMQPLIPLFDGFTKSFTKESVRNISDFFKSVNEMVVGLKPLVEWVQEKASSLPEYLPGKNPTTAGLMKRANDWANENIGKTPREAIQKAKNWLSLAERNFNPGNIRFIGQANAAEGEKGFARYGSMQEGYQALAKQLQLYGSGKSKAAGHRKLNTIEDIMGIYAPTSENDTRSYINTLVKQTGFGPKQQLDLTNVDVLSKIMSVISRVESGKQMHTPGEIKMMIQNNTGGSAVAIVGAAGANVAY